MSRAPSMPERPLAASETGEDSGSRALDHRFQARVA